MKRAYVQTARAQSAQETGERILAAAYALHTQRWYDEVTLDEIAERAGVTVQTVIRRFGSKDGIVNALAELIRSNVTETRSEAPVGDLEGIVANLVDHYETEGDAVLHLVRQEERVPAFSVITKRGKEIHAAWAADVFAPWLEKRSGIERQRLLSQLITICDLFTWYLLRRQRGLSKRQTTIALTEMLQGVLR